MRIKRIKHVKRQCRFLLEELKREGMPDEVEPLMS